MTTYIVSYEVAGLEAKAALVSLIESSGDSMQALENVWVIDTEKTAKQLRDEMKEMMAEDDKVIVLRTGAAGAWRNIYGNNKWLIDHLK